MPLYEYECQECGVFTALRKMSESHLSADCDVCGESSQRILSIPKLAVMDKSQRVAHERNEKSAHEPGVRKRSSCGCAGTHTCKTANGSPKVNPDTGVAALQMQTKKTARPWMLAH